MNNLEINTTMNELEIRVPRPMPKNCVMTLKDVVDTINMARKKEGNSSLVQHSKAMKKIKELSKTTNFGGVANMATPTINPDGSINKYLETYGLTKKQAIATAARLDNSMLMQVIDRIEELEGKAKEPKFELPKTFGEALLLAGKLEEEKQQALAVVAKQDETIKKKTKVISDIVHSGNTYTATEVAKSIGVSGLFFNKVLVAAKVLRRVGGGYTLTAKYQNYKLTEVKEYAPNDDGKTYTSLKWTSIGKQWIESNWEVAIARSGIKIPESYTLSTEAPSIPKKRK